MAGIKYTAFGKKRAGGRLVWGVLRMETGERGRFLSWHRAGEPLPLDRTVRDYARTAKDTVAVSTAARYRQFAERLAERLGSIDLRLLQKEDVGSSWLTSLSIHAITPSGPISR